MLKKVSTDKSLDLETLFSPLVGRAIVGLAVSGGADSLALMALVERWATQNAGAPRIIVYTLNHGLRPEAAAETTLVARYAKELGMDVRVLKWDGQKPKTGIQAGARRARYGLIGNAMAADGAEVLLTAHHRDDQAETLLMRMAHGSGLKGLGGMRAEAIVEGVSVFRPLLDVPKSVLEAVVAERGWTPVADPSNDDVHYERVRWRQMLPQLSQLGLDAGVLAGLAKRLGRAENALDAMADRSFAEIGVLDPFGIVRLNADKFGAADMEIQIRLVQKSLLLAGDQRKQFALAQIEQLVVALNASNFVPITLLGCKIDMHQQQVVFAREAGRMPGDVLEILPGGQLVWDARFEITNLGDALISVQLAKNARKKDIAQALGHDDFRMADIGGAPLVSSDDGAIFAVGTQVFDDAIKVRFCRAGGSHTR